MLIRCFEERSLLCPLKSYELLNVAFTPGRTALEPYEVFSIPFLPIVTALAPYCESWDAFSPNVF